MKKYIIIFTSSLLIYGCMSKDEQKAIDEISSIYHPERVSIGSGVSIGTASLQQRKLMRILLTPWVTLSLLPFVPRSTFKEDTNLVKAGLLAS